MMTLFLMALDAVLCILIVLAALEYMRSVSVFEQPVLSLAFYIVAIGAFGVFVDRTAGVPPSVWAVLLHLGIVSYAWTKRREIFHLDWRWDGVDRRRHG
jgi:hypothetical protein